MLKFIDNVEFVSLKMVWTLNRCLSYKPMVNNICFAHLSCILRHCQSQRSEVFISRQHMPRKWQSTIFQSKNCHSPSMLMRSTSIVVQELGLINRILKWCLPSMFTVLCCNLTPTHPFHILQDYYNETKSVRSSTQVVGVLVVTCDTNTLYYPDNKLHGANIGPIWGRQDPGGPYVGLMNFAIWVVTVRQQHQRTAALQNNINMLATFITPQIQLCSLLKAWDSITVHSVVAYSKCMV